MIPGKLISLRLVKETDLEHLNDLQSQVCEKGLHTDLTIRSFVHLKKQYDEHGLNKDDFTLMLITNKDDQLLSMVQHFKGYKYSTGYELGAIIYKKSNRGKGYMTEAVTLYTAYLFETQSIERIELGTSVENLGAQKVAEKCGFSFEGINRKSCYIRGQATDLKRYSILRSEVKPFNELLK